VLSGDFHVHAFVGDGGIAPWMLQNQAARVGLDVIAITNHNQTLAGRLGRWAARDPDGPLMLVGEEVTGRNFHLIAVGIEQPVNWDQPARSAIADVHAQGGVAIAAHPLRGYAEGYDEEALAAVDGLEAAYSDPVAPALARQIDEFSHRTLARNPEVAVIGSTDFHTDGPLGRCRTHLLVREHSKAGVLEAIRDGRTVIGLRFSHRARRSRSVSRSSWSGSRSSRSPSSAPARSVRLQPDFSRHMTPCFLKSACSSPDTQPKTFGSPFNF
jgi:predicted metal-dependent phosphoesterase TrpH